MKELRQPEVPDPADYRFDELPVEELIAFTWYEYAREGGAIREVIDQVRQGVDEMKASAPGVQILVDAHDEEPTPQSGRSTGVVLVQAERTEFNKIIRFSLPRQGNPTQFVELIPPLADLREFPRTPWQKIPASEEKQSFISALSCERPEPLPPLIIRSGSLHDTLKDFARGVEFHFPEMAGAGVVLEGFTRIELEYDPKEMAEEFLRQYVELRRKAGISVKRKFDRLDRSIRLLQELGALRLRHPRYGLDQEQAGNLLGIYQDRSRYLQACTAAIKHFKGHFALSDSEFPIHFSKGFRR